MNKPNKTPSELLPIPDHGITDAEMWRDVDDYHCQKKVLELLKEACPSVFLTNRARLAIANKFAPFILADTRPARDDGWTAVEDGLPESSGYYLTTSADELNHDENIYEMMFYHESLEDWEINSDVRKVIAWRPIEPYTGEPNAPKG